MHRRVIYQALAFVPVVAAAVAAGDANLAFATTSAQVINKTIVFEDRTSYAQAPGLEPAQPGDADRAFATTSAQIVHKTIVYEESAYAPYQPAEVVETVTLDKYYVQLSTPVRRRFVPDQQEIAQVGHTPFALAWARALDIPTRRRFMAEGARPAAPPLPEANDAVGWHKPLDLPVRVKRPWQLDFAYGWFTPVEAEEVTIGWHRPLETPTRAKRLPQGAMPFEARNPLPVVPWGWYAEIEKPTRAKRTPAFQLSHTFTAAAPGAGVAYNWFSALETPTRARKLYEFPATAIPVYFVPPTPGAGFELNWWPQLNEPVRGKRRVAQQLSLTVPPRLLTTTLEYAWHQRLNEPVRLPLRAGLRQFEARAPYPQITIGWFVGLGEPVRPKRRVAAQVSYTFTAAGPGAGVAYNWFTALDEPLRIRRTPKTVYGYSYYQPTFQPGPGVAYDWFSALDVPTRRDRRRIADQQDLAYGYVTPAEIFYGATSTSWQVLRRAIVFDLTAIPVYPFAAPEQPGDADLAAVTDTGMVFGRTIIFESESYSPFFPALAALDPACRVLEVLEFSGIIQSEGGQDVVPVGDADLVVEGDEDITPEPGATIKVEC